MGTEAEVVGRRIGAVIIDTVILSIVWGLLSGLLMTGPMELFVLMVPVWFLYFWALEAAWGQTIGKRILGLVVVEEDGVQLTWGASFVRNLLRFVDGLFYYVVGFFLMSLSDRKQRLGDRIANTVVVKAD